MLNTLGLVHLVLTSVNYNQALILPTFLLLSERKPKSIKFKLRRKKGLRKLLLSDWIVVSNVRTPRFKVTTRAFRGLNTKN